MPFSAKRILICRLNEFRYLPLGPLKNFLSASLKEVLVSMANSVTNASIARDITLFTLFNMLILAGVQSGNFAKSCLSCDEDPYFLAQ